MAKMRVILAPHWSESPIAGVLRPMQEFIHNSASSGIVLMIATVVALTLANSPFAAAYDSFLHTYIGISVGPYQLKHSLLHWINDGLMAIFFFLVGLEIKREIVVGELSNLRAAMLPILAALGGVVVPALLYTLFNFNRPGAAGWAIPMATDIAFALGLLALLGSRVPFGLKVFLTAVAIVDDLMAVLVIAIFYSSGINFTALSIGLGILALLTAANLYGIRTIVVYMILGALVWLAFLQSGVHATIAGVLVAWTIPARNRIDAAPFLQQARDILDQFEKSPLEPSRMLTDEAQQHAVIHLEEVCEDVQAPLQKLEHSLHFWVQFIIMPIFALANAGVAFSLSSISGTSTMVPVGIIVGLVIGKPIGLLAASWLAVRSGLAELPNGVEWRHMIGVGFLAGIGFTMSLFIASLGFGDGLLLDAAKTGILMASVIAGSIGYILLRRNQTSAPDNAPSGTESA
jgi:NhaA family Na+:H+ antiporter